MGYLILAFSLIGVTLGTFFQSQTTRDINQNEIKTLTTQQAIETVHYINAINDYRSLHRDVINQSGEMVLTASQIGIKPNSPIQHIIAGNRIFVWQPFSPGLMAALKTQTRNSALLGKAKNHRLVDNNEVDMQVVVPKRIPDGAIVYLN
ncbi:type IV pilus biogenesis protein PilM [Arsenophonus nasoniae]|jgi:hypothetical protein|uniref:type IV pilus biogenesis protein PilM n=1 Tax=Arsenophonus nasoniae TaxID=638 RepID=UPI003879E541